MSLMGLLSKLFGRKEQQLQLESLQQNIAFDKESLAAGIAAGSAKKSIENIEENTRRIVNILEERLPEKALSEQRFLESVKDSTVEKDVTAIRESLIRLPQLTQTLESAVEALQCAASSAASDARSAASAAAALQASDAIEKILPPTDKMNFTREHVKMKGEVSFEELSKELGIAVPSLRGLISRAKKRGIPFDTFTKNKEGWIRLKS